MYWAVTQVTANVQGVIFTEKEASAKSVAKIPWCPSCRDFTNPQRTTRRSRRGEGTYVVLSCDQCQGRMLAPARCRIWRLANRVFWICQAGTAIAAWLLIDDWWGAGIATVICLLFSLGFQRALRTPLRVLKTFEASLPHKRLPTERREAGPR